MATWEEPPNHLCFLICTWMDFSSFSHPQGADDLMALLTEADLAPQVDGTEPPPPVCWCRCEVLTK